MRAETLFYPCTNALHNPICNLQPTLKQAAPRQCQIQACSPMRISVPFTSNFASYIVSRCLLASITRLQLNSQGDWKHGMNRVIHAVWEEMLSTIFTILVLLIRIRRYNEEVPIPTEIQLCFLWAAKTVSKQAAKPSLKPSIQPILKLDTFPAIANWVKPF